MMSTLLCFISMYVSFKDGEVLRIKKKKETFLMDDVDHW